MLSHMSVLLHAIRNYGKLIIVMCSLTLLGFGHWQARRDYNRRLTGLGLLG